MNPLMGGMGRMMQVVNQVQQLRNNPAGVADLLKQNGRITEEQYKAIHDMKSPEQMGQYLMKSGAISQQQAMQMYQGVPMIQKQL